MSTHKDFTRAKHIKFYTGREYDPSRSYKIKGNNVIHYRPTYPIRPKDADTYVEDSTIDGRKSKLPAIWSESSFDNIERRARVLTAKDRMTLIDEAEKKKAHLQEESKKRKAILQKAQLSQKAQQGSKLSEAENEAIAKNLYILQRAFELRHEQEDDVKKANGLILATKCLAIREAQISERAIIKKELEEENRRLDAMMEEDRQRALKEEEVEKRKQVEKSQKYVDEVCRQIQENEVKRLIEAEFREEEARNVMKAVHAMKQEEAEKLEQERLKREKIKEDINRANAQIEYYKMVRKKEERMAELRLQEFMRKKARREAEKDFELMEANAAKEREIARLRAQQQKAKDQKSVLDEINALRIQEEVEREWRKREKLAASKRKELAEDMKKGREKQVKDLRRAKALEVERDEREYNQVAKIQRGLYQLDLENKRKRKEAAIQHRNDLLKQIAEKEQEHIHEHKEKFDDGIALRLDQENHKMQIQNILKKKVQTMRDNNVPENFVKDVERQLKLRTT